jgi:pyruvate ferredoxin oxidoreductase gamma subunit
MKTASRIVGTAAFRQGYYAQDSPIYGAERRGAPMVAFTRFDSKAILERGVVERPDFVVIADESLVDDPLVSPLRGLSPTGTVLINSRRDIDFTSLALEHTGSTTALSVALGAAAAKIAGLDDVFIETAVREELEEIGIKSEQLGKNIELARKVCDITNRRRSQTAATVIPAIAPDAMVTPTYQGGWLGTASVAATQNTPLRKTGDWRVTRPVIDLERCTRCSICFVDCPDGAIALVTGNAPQIDYTVCKGCMVCAEECPIHVIETIREGALS